MRTIVMSILALAICSLNVMAVPAPTDPKPAEPTKEQLEAAKEAYAKFGGKYETDTNLKTKQITRRFTMPITTTDGDLKGLPDLPFSFGLYLNSTKVTDAGLKELKELKQLTTLNINFTGQVTIEATQLENLFQGLQIREPLQPTLEPIKPTVLPPSKLAYTTQETADLLGISPKSVYRLIHRGMLKAVSALRHKRIPKTEIERFLRETTK